MTMHYGKAETTMPLLALWIALVAALTLGTLTKPDFMSTRLRALSGGVESGFPIVCE